MVSITRAQTYRLLQLDCVGVTSCLCESPVHAAHELMMWIILRSKWTLVEVARLRQSSS